MSRPTPRVLHIRWGTIETEGHDAVRKFKDAKIFPGGARGWDWRETGTEHVPGVQLADAEELLDAGADVIVLSRGMQLVLEVPPSTVLGLEALGVEVHVAQT